MIGALLLENAQTQIEMGIADPLGGDTIFDAASFMQEIHGSCFGFKVRVSLLTWWLLLTMYICLRSLSSRKASQEEEEEKGAGESSK